MNVAELKTEVFSRLTEVPPNPEWTEERILEELNEGYEELAEESEFFECSETIDLRSGVTYYDLRDITSQEPLALKAVYNNQTQRWLNWKDVRQLDGMWVQWERVTGEPEAVFLRGLFSMGLWPKKGDAKRITIEGDFGSPRYNVKEFKNEDIVGDYGSPRIVESNADGLWGIPRNLGGPITGTVTLYFTAIHPPLTNDSDEPAFPVQFHRGLVEYVLFDLFASDAETAKALTHFQEYQKFEAALFLYVKGRIRHDRIGGWRG